MNTKVIELCKNTNDPEGKKMFFDLFDRLLSCAHIQSIRFTFFVYSILNPAPIQCGLPLLLFVPFPFL